MPHQLGVVVRLWAQTHWGHTASWRGVQLGIPLVWACRPGSSHRPVLPGGQKGGFVARWRKGHAVHWLLCWGSSQWGTRFPGSILGWGRYHAGGSSGKGLQRWWVGCLCLGEAGLVREGHEELLVGGLRGRHHLAWI